MAPDDYAHVLETVTQWPPAKRLALAENLIRSLREPPAVARKATLDRAAGLLATGSRPPTDAECEEIVEGERDKKYDA
jgi:hypothetical protein